MTPMCDQVAERVALGEPLGELAGHAETCTSCRRLAALPVELGSMRREADPGLGFSARMTAGAQHRIVVPRRRRIAAGVATAIAAGTLGVLLVTRHEPASQVAQQPATSTHQQPATAEQPKPAQPDPWADQNDQAADDDVAALMQLADTDRTMQASANWKEITQPLAPYRALVKGIEP